MKHSEKLIVAITGASGAIYGRRLVEVLVRQRVPLYLIVSDPAKIVMAEELGIKWHDNASALTTLWGGAALEWITVFSNKDFAAPVSSGSHRTRGMVIIPCSMGTLAAVASGVANNLIHRTADVMLKERRPLVFVPRETPLSEIHLENMLKLRRMGASMVPAMPGFYAGTPTIEGLTDFVVGKTLDQLGIEHELFARWKESPRLEALHFDENS